MDGYDPQQQLVRLIAAEVIARIHTGEQPPVGAAARLGGVGARPEPSCGWDSSQPPHHPDAPAWHWPAPLERYVPGTRRVPVALSARHVHLSPAHVDALFGSGYLLHVQRWLSQPRQYAAEETVTLAASGGCLQRVRIVGPPRGATQVELAYTDARALGIRPPVRPSGDHRDTAGLTLVGPRGAVTITGGVIVAERHIHLHPDEASALRVKSGDRVRVRTLCARPVIFADVLCRVDPGFRLELHIDTDEGNAAALSDGDFAEIVD